MTGVDSSARDRAIEALVEKFKGPATPYDPADPADLTCMTSWIAADGYRSTGALTFGEVVDALIAHPEVLRALAGVPAPDAAEPADAVCEEWAVWEDTDTDDPNDEAARTRIREDRADAEDYVTMPKARRRSIARRTVTYSRWVAVDTHHEEARRG